MDQLDTIGITKLKLIAKELCIKGYSKYTSGNKDELITLIKEKSEEKSKEKKEEKESEGVELIDYTKAYPDNINLNSPFSLFPYQKSALAWMTDREMSSLKGGILCLKMGLGKTICSLALSLSNRTQMKKETTLIVCGKSLIGEWLNDIEKFFGNRLKVLVLHKDFNKNVNSVTKQEILDCDIVLTTYDVIVNTDSSLGASKAAFILGEDGIHKDKIIGFKQIQKPYRNYSNEKGPINLYFISWDRIITDESQKFCNAKTKIFKAMIALYATSKWCLSGTPVKNEDKDIWALFWFCGMSTVNNPKDWSYSRFKDLKLSNLIYTLDYTKTEVKETVKLPGIEKEYFDVELNEMEKKVYTSYLKQLDQAIKSSNTRMDLGSNNNFAAILGAFVRLRQTCIAPYLINTEEKEEGEKEKENISEEDEKMRLEKEQIANFMNNKFYSGINSSKIQKILEIIKGIPKGEKVVIFSSFVRPSVMSNSE